MRKLTTDEVNLVKGKGFLRNRGTDLFSGRIVSRGSVFSASEMRAIADIAEKFGSGKVSFTSRLSAEIVGIPFDKIDEAKSYALAHGISFGGTGAKIRPITACKGTTCVFGNFDTQELCREIFDRYYVGWADVKLPHKFKIGIGGCPNSCMKPSLNDFGIEGHKIPTVNKDICRNCKVCLCEKSCPMGAFRSGEVDREKCIDCGVCTNKCPFGAVNAVGGDVVYKIFAGGTWGKSTRMGTPLSRYVSRDEIFPILESCMLWFKKYAMPKERFGKAIDRIGVEKFEAEIFSGALLEERDEILKM